MNKYFRDVCVTRSSGFSIFGVQQKLKRWNEITINPNFFVLFLFFFLLWCFQLTSRVIVRSRKGLYWSYISKQQVNKAPYWVQNLVPLDLNLTWYLFRLMHCWIWLLNNNETWGLRVQPSQAKKIRRYRSLKRKATSRSMRWNIKRHAIDQNVVSKFFLGSLGASIWRKVVSASKKNGFGDRSALFSRCFIKNGLK